ncbi:MAG: hypothetical protein CM15mP125_4020 [Gammaproteobacteria bacterium]|nr:MAG: hypothetical protein CM15mP125_4020 [Gammaproteobacteria bacterium]
MDFERLGSFSPTRLSFARRLTRLMFGNNGRYLAHSLSWTRKVTVSRSIACRHRLPLPCGGFSRHLKDAQRTDRVIAEAWDLTFCLLEGDVDAELMSAVSANVPLQEAGRQHPRLLVISRANKSVRAFATVSAALASGQQPDIDHLKEAGYPYRTTAFTATVSWHCRFRST